MIDKLKEIAAKNNIQIIYGSLPINSDCTYVESYDVKVIIVNEGIKDVRLESEAIALGLGYSKAMKDLNIKVNQFNKVNKEDYKAVTKLAEEYQVEIMYNINLELISEIIKDKTDEEKEELAEDIVTNMIKNKDIKLK